MFANIHASLIISLILAGAQQPNPVRTYPLVPDHSLSATRYIEKGMPANDRRWTGKDYAQALSVLQTLAASDPSTLPRYGSATSGVVFARIVALDNLSLFPEGLTKQQRLALVVSIMENLGQITTLYVSVTTQTGVFDSELVELMRYTLELTRSVIQLTEAFLASLPANDPERDVRAKGLGQMREGMASIVDGCLITLTEKNVYRSSELVRLADTLEATLPEIMVFLPPGTQQETPIRMQRLVEQEVDATLRERLIRIVASLNKSKPR